MSIYYAVRESASLDFPPSVAKTLSYSSKYCRCYNTTKEHTMNKHTKTKFCEFGSGEKNQTQRPHCSAATTTAITVPSLPSQLQRQHCSTATVTATAIMSDRDGDGDAKASVTCSGPKKRKVKVIMSDLDLLNYYKTNHGSGLSCSCQGNCLHILKTSSSN